MYKHNNETFSSNRIKTCFTFITFQTDKYCYFETTKYVHNFRRFFWERTSFENEIIFERSAMDFTFRTYVWLRMRTVHIIRMRVCICMLHIWQNAIFENHFDTSLSFGAHSHFCSISLSVPLLLSLSLSYCRSRSIWWLLHSAANIFFVDIFSHTLLYGA